METNKLPLEFKEFEIARFEDGENWVEIEYHENNVYLVDSNLISEEIVCNGEDELLDALGY